MKELSSLARVFASLSLLTLGGGMAAYPTLTSLAVDTHRWLTLPQLDYLYSIGQAAPGPNMMMIVSIGALTAGVPGAVIVFFAYFGPTTILTFSVGRLWKKLQGRWWVAAIQRALAPVSIGLLLAGCLTFAKGAIGDWVTALVAVSAFAALMRFNVHPAFLVLAGAIVGLIGCQPQPSAFEFALIGDAPYTKVDVDSRWPNLVEDLNRHHALRFVVHDGDIKSTTGVPCSRELFAERHRQFQSIAAPFILLFGDNEWRDCESPDDPVETRVEAQLEALSLLRREFASATYPAEMNFRRHGAAYPEIVHWTVGGVRFVGLNVPGPDDNKREGYEPEYVPRRTANLAEVEAAFDEASHPKSGEPLRAVMIILQARPFVRGSFDEGSFKENPTLAGLLTAIKDGARAIAPRPVVLVHGDTHTFTIDMPIKSLPNLTRVSTFGTPSVHWIRVVVDPNDSAVFTFHPQIVQKNTVTLPPAPTIDRD